MRASDWTAVVEAGETKGFDVMVCWDGDEEGAESIDRISVRGDVEDGEGMLRAARKALMAYGGGPEQIRGDHAEMGEVHDEVVFTVLAS